MNSFGIAQLHFVAQFLGLHGGMERTGQFRHGLFMTGAGEHAVHQPDGQGDVADGVEAQQHDGAAHRADADAAGIVERAVGHLDQAGGHGIVAQHDLGQFVGWRGVTGRNGGNAAGRVGKQGEFFFPQTPHPGVQCGRCRGLRHKHPFLRQ